MVERLPEDAQDPTVSVVICTRGRSAPAPAIESVLANDWPTMELILVDQNPQGILADVVRRYRELPNFTYASAAPCGLSHARNVGLALARAKIVLFTDDDCTVPVAWVSRMSECLRGDSRTAIAFGRVVPAAYDSSVGTIPGTRWQGSHRISAPHHMVTGRTMGASMGVRRDVLLALGGFDEMFGRGSRFGSAEDTEIALRAIAHGWQVVATNDVAVTHYGFLPTDDFRRRSRQDWYALGLMYMKFLRSDFSFSLLYLGLYVLFQETLLAALRSLFTEGRLTGVGRLLALLVGLGRGARLPLDTVRTRYRL